MHPYGCMPTELYETLKSYAPEKKYPHESSSIKNFTSKYLVKIT